MQFDRRKSGVLESDELIPLLAELTPELTIGPADARYVISLCDLDGNRAISRDEVRGGRCAGCPGFTPSDGAARTLVTSL